MRRLVTYFPEGANLGVEKSQCTMDKRQIDELKQIARRYPNCRIYTNNRGNLCINYGRYLNEILA